jgi:hypothetical protein
MTIRQTVRIFHAQFFVLMLLAGSAVWAQGPPIVGARLLTPESRQFEKIEIGWQPESVPANPFAPNAITLDATVVFPSGKQIVMPGFWFQDYQRSLQNPEVSGKGAVELLRAVSSPEWRVRFASGEVALHQVTLVLRSGAETRRSAPIAVHVLAGSGGGFVRASRRNPQFLEDDSGHPFFPIGENLCMYEKREGTYYFDRLMGHLAAGGGNYVRLWQEYYVPKDPKIIAGPGDSSFAGFPLETQVTGLGRYDLPSAWRLDYVAGLAERLGIRWQLAFEMVVWWEEKMTHRWPRNPYNAANGGPCLKPSDYFTAPRARELVKRRLRYSVARWGWATNLVAWELWNEVDNMDGFTSEANVAWHREMGRYLKQVDPFGHLITTSWRDPGMFALPEITLVQAHSYWAQPYDAAQYSLQDTDHLMRPYGKPFFFGEQGMEGDLKVDPEGKNFHDCLWTTAVSGAAGVGMYWWWHNYVDDNSLYLHYRPLAKFVAGVDWPSRHWTPIHLTLPNLPVSMNAYGVSGGDRALLWLHDPLAFRIIDDKAVRGGPQVKAKANVAPLEDGEYTVEWWDTSTGAIVRTDPGVVNHLTDFGYGLELNPPEFWGDIAARVIKKGAHWE